MTERIADVAVIGAGIVGLSQAWEAARRGKRVVVFERDAKAKMASVRNFGMVWPIGQPAGRLYEIACQSRERWLEFAESAGIWLDRCGSLHLTYADDEWSVVNEFVEQAPRNRVRAEAITPDEARKLCPAVRLDGLRGALWSDTELCVDPREAIAILPEYLSREYGVNLQFNRAITKVDSKYVHTANGETWNVGRVIVCSGADFETLFPNLFAEAGIRRCKLQMLRTPPQPPGWRLGPHLAAGLTLCHYESFRDCPTLERLRQRVRMEFPDYVHYGIHVMASQNGRGEVLIGDSHEYDADIQPFDKQKIDDLILKYLNSMVTLPNRTIEARWHGIYSKSRSEPLFVQEPLDSVYVVNAAGGGGMTMSFGWAARLWEEWELAESNCFIR